MTALAVQALEEARSDHDHVVVLTDVTWADYERLLEVRGERSAPRLTYLDGMLEIMSPSRSHESVKSFIGCLVEVYCLENDIEFNTFGSWTLKSRRRKGGAEPDECYVFGAASDPKRPDLAIEVVWTSRRIDKLEVYLKLGVREVWYWEAGTIRPYVLRGARYQAARKSKALPQLDLAELARFIDGPTTSHAIRAYRAALGRKAPKRKR